MRLSPRRKFHALVQILTWERVSAVLSGREGGIKVQYVLSVSERYHGLGLSRDKAWRVGTTEKDTRNLTNLFGLGTRERSQRPG